MRFFLAIALIFTATQAHAGRGIPSPYVTEGKTSLTTDGFYNYDSDASKQNFRERFSFDSGITDKLAFRFRASIEDPAGGSTVFKRIEIGGKAELAEKGEWPIDVGLYFTLVSDLENNRRFAQPRLLLAKDLENWRHTANFILNRELQADKSLSESTTSFNFSSFYKLDASSNIGVEYYGNFGEIGNLDNYEDQAHLFGPSITHKFEDTSFLGQLSLIGGLTKNSPAASFKWKLSYGF